MSAGPAGPLRRFFPGASRPAVWFAALIILLSCYRFTLIGKGHFYWSDERGYLPASRLVDAAVNGEYRQAAGHLYEAPGAVSPAPRKFVVMWPGREH